MSLAKHMAMVLPETSFLSVNVFAQKLAVTFWLILLFTAIILAKTKFGLAFVVGIRTQSETKQKLVFSICNKCQKTRLSY